MTHIETIPPSLETAEQYTFDAIVLGMQAVEPCVELEDVSPYVDAPTMINGQPSGPKPGGEGQERPGGNKPDTKRPGGGAGTRP